MEARTVLRVSSSLCSIQSKRRRRRRKKRSRKKEKEERECLIFSLVSEETEMTEKIIYERRGRRGGLPLEGTDGHELLQDFVSDSRAPLLEFLDQGLEDRNALGLKIPREQGPRLVTLEKEREGMISAIRKELEENKETIAGLTS